MVSHKISNSCVCIHQAFGDLVNRFRCFSGTFEMGGKDCENRFHIIVRAAVILHNLCIDDGDGNDWEGEDEDEEEEKGENEDEDEEAPVEACASSTAMRNATKLHLSKCFRLKPGDKSKWETKPSHKFKKQKLFHAAL